jgi:hypothetical protein
VREICDIFPATYALEIFDTAVVVYKRKVIKKSKAISVTVLGGL